MEDRTAEVEKKLKLLQQEKKKLEQSAYINPEIGEQARRTVGEWVAPCHD